MKRCLYCNQNKKEDEFSEEHILPQAIGGNLFPTNPFKSGDICQRCNNLCGLFVDAPFIKSWLTQSDIVEEAQRYVKFNENTVFPLQYIGFLPDLNEGSRICEFWIGPTGDTIYHFHEPYPEVKDMPSLVGPAPNVKSKVDRGFAFIYIVSSNPVWLQPILRSFVTQFEKSELYVGNGNCSVGGLLSPIPDELKELHDKISGIQGVSHNLRTHISLGYETRFLAKLALGIGHLFLDSSFSTSEDARLLRDMMWEKNSDVREKNLVRGSGFLSRNTVTMKKFLSWRTGHLIAVIPAGEDLILYSSFYDHQTSVVKITGNSKHWKNTISETGIVFVVNPGLKKFTGPIPVIDFVEHQQGVKLNVALKALSDEATQVSSLPPVHLP